METIKFYDLESMATSHGKGRRITSDLYLYSNPMKGKRTTSHTIQINKKFIVDDFNKVNFAQNVLTGEVFLVFSKTAGISFIQEPSKQRFRIQKKRILFLLVELLNIKYNAVDGLHIKLNLSPNLSKTDDVITYKILK